MGQDGAERLGRRAALMSMLDPLGTAEAAMVPQPVFEDPGVLVNSFGQSDAPEVPVQVPAKQLLLGSGTVGARESHRSWRAANPSQPLDPSQLSPSSAKLAKDRPGLSQHQLAVLSADDEVASVAGFRRWDNSLEKDAAASAIVRRLAGEGVDLPGAQVDLARFGQAMEQGLLGAAGENERVRQLWQQFTEDPESLLADPVAADELVSAIRSVGDELDSVDVDMSIGLAGRVSGIDMVGGQPLIHVDHPVGWADGRSTEPAVRGQRLARLNYRALQEAGQRNVRRMFLLGRERFAEILDQEPPEFVADLPAVEAFLGMDTGLDGRPSPADESRSAVVASAFDQVSDEFGVPAGAVRAIVAEVWRDAKLNSPRAGWGRGEPFVFPDEMGPNQAFEALSGRGVLPSSLDVEQGPIPASVLQTAVSGDLTSITLPSGSVAVATSITDASATTLRNQYPALVGADGVPRWAQAKPAPIRSYESKARELRQLPGAQVDTMLSSDLAAKGGHPALRPGEFIAVTVPDTDKATIPRDMGAGSPEPLGRVSVDEPERQVARLGPEDMTPDQFKDFSSGPLGTHQWAVLSVDPAVQNEALASLVRQGYKPLVVRTTTGEIEQDSLLLFGVDPDEADSLGTKFGASAVVNNDGWVRGEPAEFQMVVNIAGEAIRWSASFDDQDDELPAAGRRRRTGRRALIPVTDSSKIADLADDLERRGFADVAVYSSRPSLDGWQRAYEEVMTDGPQTVSVRYRNGSSTSPHGSHVFVRDAAGLPDRPNRPVSDVEIVDPDAELHGWDGRRLVPAENPEAFSATIDRSGRIRLRDSGDLTPALDLRSAVEGLREVKDLETPDGTFSFASLKPPTTDGDSFRLPNGMLVPRGRRDRPVKAFEQRFGFEFDPGYRLGRNDTLTLPDPVQSEITDVTSAFMDRHADAVRRFRLSRVTVSNSPDSTFYAHTVDQPGGEIVLNKELWRDIPTLKRRLEADRSAGLLSRRVPPTPASVVAHEYGHVLYGAVRAAEGSKVSSPLEQEIRNQLGGRHWSTAASRKVSETAGASIAELVAEAVSEVVMGSPSPTSRWVYELLSNHLERTLAVKEASNW